MQLKHFFHIFEPPKQLLPMERMHVYCSGKGFLKFYNDWP